MRGKPWSDDEERQLRQLIEEGRSLDEISRRMGKTRVSVKSKLFNSGLNLLKDATGLQKKVAVAVAAASSPLTPTIVPLSAPALDPISASTVDASVDVACVEKKLPERLPSVEEQLKVLNEAIQALRQPGLSRAEASRLHNIIVGVKVYQELFAKFVDYCGLESEVLELRRQLASENAKAFSKDSSNVSR